MRWLLIWPVYRILYALSPLLRSARRAGSTIPEANGRLDPGREGGQPTGTAWTRANVRPPVSLLARLALALLLPLAAYVRLARIVRANGRSRQRIGRLSEFVYEGFDE